MKNLFNLQIILLLKLACDTEKETFTGSFSVGISEILKCIHMFQKAQQYQCLLLWVMWEPTVNADPEQAPAFFSLCGLRPPEMQMNIFLHTALI